MQSTSDHWYRGLGQGESSGTYAPCDTSWVFLSLGLKPYQTSIPLDTLAKTTKSTKHVNPLELAPNQPLNSIAIPPTSGPIFYSESQPGANKSKLYLISSQSPDELFSRSPEPTPSYVPTGKPLFPQPYTVLLILSTIISTRYTYSHHSAKARSRVNTCCARTFTIIPTARKFVLHK